VQPLPAWNEAGPKSVRAGAELGSLSGLKRRRVPARPDVGFAGFERWVGGARCNKRFLLSLAVAAERVNQCGAASPAGEPV
jgi:hypothetical protein